MKTQIVKTSAAGRMGYSVAILFSLDMGDSFERMTHRVVFESRREADAMAERITKAVRELGPYKAPTWALDFSQWLWQADSASYDGRLQVPPTATPAFRPARTA